MEESLERCRYTLRRKIHVHEGAGDIYDSKDAKCRGSDSRSV